MCYRINVSLLSVCTLQQYCMHSNAAGGDTSTRRYYLLKNTCFAAHCYQEPSSRPQGIHNLNGRSSDSPPGANAFPSGRTVAFECLHPIKEAYSCGTVQDSHLFPF